LDDFIQGIQLKNKYDDIVFEWIPYNQFNDIKYIDIKGNFALATWNDGPLCMIRIKGNMQEIILIQVACFKMFI
jgi:hypothetical protein